MIALFTFAFAMEHSNIYFLSALIFVSPHSLFNRFRLRKSEMSAKQRERDKKAAPNYSRKSCRKSFANIFGHTRCFFAALVLVNNRTLLTIIHKLRGLVRKECVCICWYSGQYIAVHQLKYI